MTDRNVRKVYDINCHYYTHTIQQAKHDEEPCERLNKYQTQHVINCIGLSE